MTETAHPAQRLPGDIGGPPADPIERWIGAFANPAYQTQLLHPEEPARKMDEVAARHPAS